MNIGLGTSPDAPVVINTANKGVVNFISNDELDKIEDEKQRANQPTIVEVPLGTLATHVKTFFASAKTAKQDIETKMLSILCQIKGEYEADKLADINNYGGSSDFIRLTQHKARDAEAWIVDIINPYGDKTWDIEPTPISDLPSDVIDVMKNKLRSKMVQQAVTTATTQGQQFNSNALMQQMQGAEKFIAKKIKKKVQEIAKQRSANMKRKILDQLEEGGWNDAFRSCINDLSRLKSCIMKGPVFKKVPTLKWEQDADDKWAAKKSTDIVPVFSRVSPFDWFPAAKSSHVNQGGSIEVEHLSVSDLEEVIGNPGYKNEVIKDLLTNHPYGYKEGLAVDIERQALEKDNTISDSHVEVTYDMLNYWGKVKGELLLEHGMSDIEIKPDKYYNVNIKTINNQLIKDPILNPDPLGAKPYSVTSFIKNNDSQWGECPAELMIDIQSICNASVRALVNNIAISSGPITEMDVDRLAPGESGEIWPWKRILTTNKQMREGPAVQFYQAKLLAGELLATYEKFKKEADDLVVPAYGRTDMGGAGRTSSGLAMLMSAAARNIKLAIHNIDMDVTLPVIIRLFNFNMLFSDDNSIKGDIHIKARGTSGVIAKEQLAVRRNEFRATLRPTDEQLIGAPGLAYILRKNIESLDMDVDKAMPGYTDLEDLDALTPPPALGEGATGARQFPKAAPLEVGGAPVGGAKDASLFREAENNDSSR